MTPLDNHLNLLTRLLDATEMRQKVIGQNIANVNTPGYRRMDVSFEAALAQELTGPSGGPSGDKATPTIEYTPGLSTRADGNNVDIDMEIGQMDKNALLQQVYLQVMGAEMSMMRKAIEGN